jgi:hypothetical protein
MRTLQSEAHLRPIQTLLLSEASSQCETVKDAPRNNASVHSETKLRTDTRRHFELSQDEITGFLSEVEIDAARRRGWM